MAITHFLTAVASSDALQWDNINDVLAGTTTGDRVLSCHRSTKVISWQTVPVGSSALATFAAIYAPLGIDSATDVLAWYS